MRRLNRNLLRGFLVAELALTLSMLRDVANVTTERLYLSARVDAPARSDAAERFDVEDTRVVPQIASRDRDRIAFRAGNPWPSTLHAQVRPAGPAHIEIQWRDAAGDRILAQSDVTNATTVSARLPARPGVLSLVSRGAVTWVDPRIVGDLRITGRATVFVLLAALAILVRRRQAAAGRGHEGSRLAAFRWMAATAGVMMAAAALEVGLRALALGDHVPPTLLAERHDLGEVRKDPRWEHTRRYGRRLRPRVAEMSEWRHGDIVRMGFVPADATDGLLHRFPFRTDAEGFRNARTRDRIDVAALGDSFTDAMTLEEADAWPRLLEQQSGLAVQNYGTAGFGPQQELRVLTDYALAHHPRVVVLAYFAGNDLFDAEAFDDYERSNGTVRRPDPGWPIKAVVSRADTWFVVSALHAARRWTASLSRVEARTPAPEPAPAPVGARAPGFDRGLFTLPVNGQMLRWAFMPPYLNTLRMSERDLSARRGWTLTKAAMTAMRDSSRARGAELVVMFLPFKSQVYLPLVDAAMPRDDVAKALRYSLPDGSIDVAAMLRNRRAQNDMLRRFCADAGIPFLDTTDALAAHVNNGSNVYFPDESHLNESGHAVVAAALGEFLQDSCGPAVQRERATAADADRGSGISARACLRTSR